MVELMMLVGLILVVVRMLTEVMVMASLILVIK